MYFGLLLLDSSRAWIGPPIYVFNAITSLSNIRAQGLHATQEVTCPWLHSMQVALAPQHLTMCSPSLPPKQHESPAATTMLGFLFPSPHWLVRSMTPSAMLVIILPLLLHEPPAATTTWAVSLPCCHVIPLLPLLCRLFPLPSSCCCMRSTRPLLKPSHWL